MATQYEHHPTDLTQLPEQILLDLINADHGTQLTTDLVAFGLPVVMAADFQRNTELNVYGAQNSPFRGSVNIYYNRLAITDIIGTQSTEFGSGNAQRWRDLIPAINARYGINLTTEDYVDGAVYAPDYGVTVVQRLQMNPNSLVYIGQVDLSIIGNVEKGIDLSTILLDTHISQAFDINATA